MRSVLGSLASPCQIMAGGLPVAASSATAASRSQFDPGKTMTAVFIPAPISPPLKGRDGPTLLVGAGVKNGKDPHPNGFAVRPPPCRGRDQGPTPPQAHRRNSR